MKRILMCGSRTWKDRRIIRLVISRYDPKQTIILNGNHWEGADKIIVEEAEKAGYWVVKFPAPWKTFGRGAGPMRNELMYELKPDVVIAFNVYQPNSKSKYTKGTEDTIRKAQERGIPTETFWEYEDEQTHQSSM